MLGHRVWKHRTGEFVLGGRTLIMGIVNVTPDSFSDGGKYFDAGAAAAHAMALRDAGADLVDLGAESTRPGSQPVSASEQLQRLLPVLDRLRQQLNIPISIDTSLSEVAALCLGKGAAIINDVTGLRQDSNLAHVCAQSGAGVVVMHMRGTPATMQTDISYADLFSEIHSFLFDSVAYALHAGIQQDHIVVDPGIGFGKTFEQNYLLLGGMKRFSDLAAGVLAGPSRKAFTGEFNERPAEQRQYSTAAAVALAALNGADIVRVHDVAEMRQITDIIDRFREIHEQDRF
ncbi:MAG: dihydropteroate synthase [Calditrichota bacterium]